LPPTRHALALMISRAEWWSRADGMIAQALISGGGRTPGALCQFR
jgi:hypothetical protein